MLRFGSLLLLGSLTMACGGGSDEVTDEPIDSSVKVDSGATDTGSTIDTGSATTDTGSKPDTGTAATDTGTPASDTGSTSDAASSSDTGTAATDTGSTSDTGSTTDTGAATDSATSTDTGITTDAGGDAAVTVDYSMTGPYTVKKSDTKVGSNSVHLLVPSTVKGAVVFAHGFQLKTTDYDLILSHVASYGFVVVSTDYPGSLFSMDHRDVRDAIVAARKALIDGKITGAPAVDPAHIASSGHSLGGKGAVMAALAEPAFTATLAFDPVDGNPSPGGTADAAHPKLTPTETAKLLHPIGYFGATQSRCSSLGTACAPETLDAATFYAGTPSTITRYLWTVFDYGHMQFLDADCGFTCASCVKGKTDADARKAVIKAMAAAFFARFLDGQTAAQPWLDGARRDAAVSSGVLWDGVKAKPACG